MTRSAEEAHQRRPGRINGSVVPPVDQHLGIEGQQTRRSVGRRQGVGHVSPDSGNVSHLGPANHGAALGKGGTPFSDRRMGAYFGMGGRGPNNDRVPFYPDFSEFGYLAHVYQRVGLLFVPAFEIENEVGSSGDDAGLRSVAVKVFESLADGARTNVLVPGCHIKKKYNYY